MSSPALELRHVSLRLGGATILNDVNMEVASGEIVALIGPNGAGKSTLVNCIAGVRRPDLGEILLSGRNISNEGARTRVRLGLGRTYQTANLFEGLTVYENVLLAADAQRGASVSRADVRRRTGEALSSVGLDRYVDSLVSLLPHGARRQVELAMLLSSGATTLLLDEPTAGLSAEDLGALEQLLLKARGAGCAAVLVEHRMGFVTRLADRLVVLSAGSVLVSGSVDEVISNRLVQEAYLGRSM